MLLKQGFYWICIHLGCTCSHTSWSLWFCGKSTHLFISVKVTKFTKEREKSVPTNVTTSVMWPHCIGDPCLPLRTYSRLRHLSAYCLFYPQILHFPKFTSHEAHSECFIFVKSIFCSDESARSFLVLIWDVQSVRPLMVNVHPTSHSSASWV